MSDIEENIKRLKFDDNGLIPAVVQDYSDGMVLMVAYMNELAVRHTIESGIAHYWSRSRQELWKKGGTSGHTQEIKDFRIDCDADCILLVVKQNGPGACHTGHRSCFYRDISGNELDKKTFDDEEVYGKKD